MSGVTVSDLDKRATVVDDDASSGCEGARQQEIQARQLIHYSLLPRPVETDEDGSSVSSANSDTLSDDLEDEEDLERALAAYRPEDETLSERFYALKDMVSPTTRRRIAETWSTSTSWAFWGGKAAGNAIWIATTSALLVGLPLAMAIENETMMVQQEKEMLGQQQGAQQMMGNSQPSDGVRPAGF